MLPIVTLDFETYFDRDYTLRKMTTESYIRDPRFRAHGCAIRLPKEATLKPLAGRTLHFDDPFPTCVWVEHDYLRDIFSSIPWYDVAVLCHHAHFDGLILSHHFGIRPRMWLDTMCMGRLLLGNHVSVGLESLATHFALQPKTVPYDRMKGRHWSEMDEVLRRDVAAGAIHDVGLTWDLFCQMAPFFPAEEFALVDATVRMFTEPVLVGNTARLDETIDAERHRKEIILASLGATPEELRSKQKFADLLRGCGVEIASVEYAHYYYANRDKVPFPTGWKDTNAGLDYAFAKSDGFMQNLLEDADERICALAEGRLALTSSIIVTRASRLRDMSGRGDMCVYLAPFAAHTTRFGGGDKLNWQNFPRNSDLGKAIEAPPGHLIVTVDASQIECRMLNTLARQDDMVEKFRRKEDPYIDNASRFYGHDVYKPKECDPRYDEMLAKRGFGKQLELQCGFGAGGPSIVATAKRGTYGPPVFLTEQQGMQARDLYRASHPHVCQLWNEAEYCLRWIAGGLHLTWLDCLEIRDMCIYLPDGAPLIYNTLQWFDGTGRNDIRRGWLFKTRRGPQKLYGAKLVENIVQALSRVHTTQAWLRLQSADIRMVSMEHDKLIAVVPEKLAEGVLLEMMTEMCRPPAWLPGIPLDSDGYISRTLKR